MKSHTVVVSSGKYTFVSSDGTLSIKILRYGEAWHEQVDAYNALHSIMCELDAARVVVAAARALVDRDEAPVALRDALDTHSALVGDTQPPSDWCGPAPAPLPVLAAERNVMDGGDGWPPDDRTPAQVAAKESR